MTLHTLIIPALGRVVKVGYVYPVKPDLPVHRETHEITVNEIYPPSAEKPNGLMICNRMDEKGKMPAHNEFEPSVIGAQFIPDSVAACTECDTIVQTDGTLCTYHQQKADRIAAAAQFKVEMDKKISELPMDVTGLLENWWIEQYGPTGGTYTLVHGDMYGDRRNRFTNGSPVHTSRVTDGKFAEGEIITTLNSKYKLGKQFVAPVQD